MSERIVIETPENISFGYDVAGLGSRFIAALVDSLIQGSIYTFLLIVYFLIGLMPVLENAPAALTTLLPVLVLLTAFLVWFGYYISFEIFMNGQSPGKRLLNLRVIKENGRPLAVLDSVIRNLVRLVDFFPFAYGVGVLVMFLNDRSRRLGDLAAGTLVVNIHETIKLSELRTASTRMAAAPAPPVLAGQVLPSLVDAQSAAPQIPGIENLSPSDIDLVESYLARRPSLKNAASLGAQIASRVQLRLANGSALAFSDDGAHERPDIFLQQVVAAYRASHAHR